MLQKFGPLVHTSSMRFEGRHKTLKNNAKVVQSRKNIIYTLAIKNQLVQCERFISKRGLCRNIVFGVTQFIKLSDIFFDMKNKIFEYFKPCDMMYFYSWIQVSGVTYKPNLIVLLCYEDFFPKFGQITHLLSKDNKALYFVYNDVETVCFNDHYRAYEIKIKCEANIINLENLNNILPMTDHLMSDGKLYVLMLR